MRKKKYYRTLDDVIKFINKEIRIFKDSQFTPKKEADSIIYALTNVKRFIKEDTDWLEI